MCNLCGCAGELTVKEEKVFTDLLVMGSLRGQDSTGVAAIPRGPGKAPPRVIKELGPPFGLLDQTAFAKILRQHNKVLIGHNRFATKGHISIENAHPFHFVDPDKNSKSIIIGAHNGTLGPEGAKNLGNDEYGTDSQSIFWSLAVYPDPRDTIKKLTGAYALVWYDFRNNSINLLRNSLRPLFYRFSEYHSTLYWASELEMLYAATNRNGIKADSKNVHILPEDTLISWEVPEAFSKFGEPLVREKIEGKKFTPTVLPALVTQATNLTTNNKITSIGGKIDIEAKLLKSGEAASSVSKLNPQIKPHSGMVWSFYSHQWVWPYKLEEEKINSKLKYCDTYDDTDCSININDDSVIQQDFVDGKWVEAQNEVLNTAISTVAITSVGTPAKPKPMIHSPSSPVSNLEALAAPLLKTSPVKEVTNNKDHITTLVDKRKDMLFEKCVKEYVLDDCFKIFMSNSVKALWDKGNRCWYIFKWIGPASGWERVVSDYATEDVPYSTINIDAGGDHRFKYDTRKTIDPTTQQKIKTRVVMWKGYNSILLTQKAFEDHMKDGCLGCGRHPKWGNPVTFVSKYHFFCEYCSLDNKTVLEFLDMNKKSA